MSLRSRVSPTTATSPTSRHPWSRALVTGASAGIGKAIAEQLIDAGVPTIVVARRTDRLNELATRSPLAEPLTADLQTLEGCQRVADRLRSSEDPIDLLVNNAGYGIAGNVSELSPADAVGMIDLNVRALTELTNATLPRMLAADRGWIMQVSSVASFQPGPGAAIYSATKAYVSSFTEALSEELRGTSVKVSALCPGFTHTEFHSVSAASSPSQKTTEGNVPEFAWLSAEAVAASGLHALAEGKVLDIPGGLYKGVVAVSSVLPRRVVRRVVGTAAKRL